MDKKVFDLFHIRYNAAHRGAETEVFSQLNQEAEPETSPGIVTYTATRWGQLLKQKNMPGNESALTASDCYRFVLSNPSVDICLTGPKNQEQMQHALTSLEAGPFNEEEMDRIKKIGDHVHSSVKSFFA